MMNVRDLETLPKGHLHLHLEGSMRPATLAELAAEHGLEVPPTRGYGNFGAFAGLYRAACAVIVRPDDLRRVVGEVVEDAALDGAWWVEPSFHLPHQRNVVADDHELLELVLDAAHDAAARLGIGVGLILTADRTAPVEQAVELARLAADHAGRGVVGFGLANDESTHPPEPFGPAFDIAREAGLLSIPHAGELAGPESVRAALDRLGADRLQHGVRVVEDPALTARLAADDICCDVCPTSNLMLSVCASLAEHPLPALLEAGVPCSLNADDSLLFGAGLLDEYRLARDEVGLDDAQLASVAWSSLRCSAAPADVQQRARAAIDAWLSSPPSSPGPG